MNPKKKNPAPEVTGNQMNIALSDSAVGTAMVAPPFGLAASGPEATPVQESAPQSTSRVPEGKIISGSVGLGGKNYPEDVEAVLARLLAMRLINFREYETRDEKSLGMYVTRYQGRVFNSYRDGLVEASGKTEQHLIDLNHGKLKAIPKKKQTTPEQNASINYDDLAGKLDTALKGGFLGLGRDHKAAFHAFRAADPDIDQLGLLRVAYQKRTGKDLAQEVKSVYHVHGGGSGLDWLWETLGLMEAVAEIGMEMEQAPKTTTSGDTQEVHQIISPEDWRTQSSSPKPENKKWQDYEHGGSNCKFVAENMVYRHLYPDLPKKFKHDKVVQDATGKYKYAVGSIGASQYLSVLREDKSEVKNISAGKHKQSTFEVQDSSQLALAYLDSYLEQKIPMVVGVDHTFNRSLKKDHEKTSSQKTRGYNEGTTDHFITIVGKGIDGKGRKFYEFYDPGTQWKDSATNLKSNRLVEVEPMVFKGTQPWGKIPKTYHLASVMLFKKDFVNYKDQIAQNRSTTSQLDSDFKNKKGDFKA